MSDTKESEQPLLLKDLIRQVRNELTEAVDERKRNNEEGMFAVKSLTLEVNFTVEKNVKADAGGEANFWIFKVNAGGEGSRRSEQVHKITLELSPYNPKPAAEPPAGGLSYSPGLRTIRSFGGGRIVLGIPKEEGFPGIPVDLETSIKDMDWSALEKLFPGSSVEISTSLPDKKK